jgi:hypothetical protein
MVWLMRQGLDNIVAKGQWLKWCGCSFDAQAAKRGEARRCQRVADAAALLLAANEGWRWLRRVLANVGWCGLVWVAGMVWLLV